MGSSTVHATHEELAARCGVSRPKLTTELKRLEAQGLIRRGRGALDILSLPSSLSGLQFEQAPADLAASLDGGAANWQEVAIPSGQLTLLTSALIDGKTYDSIDMSFPASGGGDTAICAGITAGGVSGIPRGGSRRHEHERAFKDREN